LSTDSFTLAHQIALLAMEKKSKNVVILDLRGISIIADFFIIADGFSTTHTRAISDGITQTLSQQNKKLLQREGYEDARWILLDYGDIIVHIFREQERKFYNLEGGVWGGAPRYYLEENGNLSKYE